MRLGTVRTVAPYMKILYLWRVMKEVPGYTLKVSTKIVPTQECADAGRKPLGQIWVDSWRVQNQEAWQNSGSTGCIATVFSDATSGINRGAWMMSGDWD